MLNLGGIGNFTLLPAAGAVRGFDTGPANALMDAWCQRHFGEAFDRDGAMAARGTVDRALLTRLLDEAWFALPPPKSTGREQFHLDWVQARLGGHERAEDVQATLLELTAVTVCQALRREQPASRRVLVCGGGVRNGALMARIGELLGDVEVVSTAALGLDPDYVEAMAFAWLARQTLAGAPGNLPAVTGARAGAPIPGTSAMAAGATSTDAEPAPSFSRVRRLSANWGGVFMQGGSSMAGAGMAEGIAALRSRKGTDDSSMAAAK